MPLYLGSDANYYWDYATKRLNLTSLTTGIAHYNTVDQVTDYERFVSAWNSNVFELKTEFGGAGNNRALRIGTPTSAGGAMANYLSMSGGATAPYFSFTRSSTAAGNFVDMSGVTLAASTGVTQVGFAVNPTISQSSSAAYTALLVNPTESATGSGVKNLAQFSASSVQKAAISSAGWGRFGGTGAPVSALESGGSFGVAIGGISSNFTAGNNATITANATSGAIVVTLPDATLCNGRIYTLKKTDATANAVSFDGNGSQTIDKALTKSTTEEDAVMSIQSNAANWVVTAQKGTWT